MHSLLAVGVTLLTATAPAQPQPALTTSQPLNVTFVMPVAFEDTISFLAKTSGVTIEFDDTVSAELRRQPPSDYTITLRGVTLEEAIAQLTRARGLDYMIVGEKTVRIYKKA
jgi:hypothetical protein